MPDDSLEHAVHDLDAIVAKWDTILKAIRTLVVGAFLLGGWVATLEYRQRVLAEVQKEDHIALQENKLWRAEIEANRWTIQQHQQF